MIKCCKLLLNWHILIFADKNNNETESMIGFSLEDITGLMLGDTVQLKLPAYDDTEFEYINGTVTSISKIPLNISERGVVYSVKIIPEIIPKDIKPGMEGSVDIIVGTRTVMEYFLEPFKIGLVNVLEED